MTSSPAYAELLGRLDKRSKAIRDLWEIATHIGVFPLDAMKIDADIHDKSASAIRTLMERVEGLEKVLEEIAHAKGYNGSLCADSEDCPNCFARRFLDRAPLRGGNDETAG